MFPFGHRWILYVIAFLLFVANALLIRELFGIAYPASMYSIEAAYVGLARHYMEAGPFPGWFPYWYGGLPTFSTYPPLLHWMVAGVATVFGLDAAHAYHVVTASTYCLVAVAVYGCAYALCRQPVPSAMAGLMATLVSPSAILLSAPFQDLGGWQGPRRLQTLWKYGEGPHVTSLMWMFAGIALLHLALETRKGLWRVLASLALAATVLTNTIGAAALAIMAVAYLLARPDALRWRPWRDAALLGVLAYLLAAPMLPPSTLMAIRQNAPFVGGVYQGSAVTYGLLLLHLVIGGCTAHALRQLGVSLLLRFAVAALIPLSGITVSRTLYGLPLLPQPDRYHLEMELLLILAVSAAVAMLWERLPRRRWIPYAALAAVLAFSVIQVRGTRFHVRNELRSGTVADTIEFQTGRWLAQHFSKERVHVAGSISFWLHAFTDTPQLGGGYDNGVQNPNYLAVNYQIYSGDGAGLREAHIAVTWLKAFGVRAVQAVYPDSPEVFHPYRNPAKYEGVLEELWRHRGTVFYAVPARHAGLASVIPEDAVPRRRPQNGLDVQEAERYVTAMEDASLPVAAWRWLSSTEAETEAETRNGEVLSVRVAYHPGWEASDRSGPVKVEGDGLGQMILRVPSGVHHIRLRFTGGAEKWVLWGLFALGLMLAIWLCRTSGGGASAYGSRPDHGQTTAKSDQGLPNAMAGGIHARH